MTNMMEEQQVTPMQTAMKWGVYAGIAVIIFDLVLYVLGMKSASGGNSIQYLVFIVFIVFVVLAIKSYAETNGYMSFGQGLGSGVLTSLVTAVIVAIYSYLFMTLIAPDFMDGAMDAVRDQWEAQGMSDEQIEQAEGFTEMFMTPGVMTIMAVVMYTVLGFITSLIASAVLKRD